MPPRPASALAGPAERRLLAACLLLRDEATLAPLAEAVGWVGVLWIAREVQAVPPLAHALLAASLPLPPSVRTTLEEALAAETARNALLLAELAGAQDLLRAAGIRSAALKGTALVAAHYPAPGARHLADIDLLVAPAALSAAAAALAGAGFAPPPSALPSVGGGEDPLARNPGMDHLRALATPGGAVLELHDALPGGGPPPEAVVERARRVTWRGRDLDVCAPDDLAGTLCRHVFLKHGDEVRLRARHLVDLTVLAPIAWDAVRRGYGAGAGADALGRSQALVTAAQEAADRAGPDPLSPLLDPAGSAARARAGLGRAVRTLRAPGALRALFPARRYMAARYGVPPSSARLLLLYPWRLLAGAARWLQGGARTRSGR